MGGSSPKTCAPPTKWMGSANEVSGAPPMKWGGQQDPRAPIGGGHLIQKNLEFWYTGVSLCVMMGKLFHWAMFYNKTVVSNHFPRCVV